MSKSPELNQQPPLDRLDSKFVYDDPELLEVYDGDTIRIRIDVGWDQDLKMWVRLSGYNAAEVRGKQKNAGLLAQLALATLFEDRKRLIVESFINKKHSRIKSFDRFVCQAWVQRADGSWINVSEQMIADGWHAERS